MDLDRLRTLPRLPVRRAIHRREIRMLASAPWDDPAVMDALRFRRLRRTVERARKTSPFYSQVLAGATGPIRSLDDLASLPVTSKLDMRAAGLDRAAPGSRFRGRETWRTSGSSGEPFGFDVGGFYGDRHNAQRAYVYRLAGVPEGSAISEIHSFDRHFPPQRNYPTYRRTVIGYRTPGWVDVVLADPPTLLYGNVSHLVEVADAAAAAGSPPSIPFVCSSSETLLPSVERRFVDLFGAQVFEVYGSAEISNAAFRLQDQPTWTILEPRVIVEVLDREHRPVPVGEVGEMVVTTLTEPTAPMIRYATGDLARVESGSASGTSGLRLAALEGRVSDAVVDADGRRVTFWEIGANRFWAWGALAENIDRWQIHQRPDRSVRVSLQLLPEGRVDAVAGVIEEHLVSKLGRLPVEIVVTDRVHDPAKGKFRAVTSEATPTA